MLGIYDFHFQIRLRRQLRAFSIQTTVLCSPLIPHFTFLGRGSACQGIPFPAIARVYFHVHLIFYDLELNMVQVTICQQCGDKGFSSVLIYCCKCRISAVHHYCLDVYPTKFECVSWCCEECESQVGKPSTACNPISLLHGANDAENVETVRAAQSEIRSKKNMQKKEETICLQCGDKGLYEALVFCYKCQDAALHRYCLDVLPIFKGPLIWYCEDCEPKVNKPSTTCNPISIVHKAHDSGLKNRQERDVSGSLSKSEEVHGGGNSPCHHLIEMHCSENHEKDQKFIKRCREPDESNSDEDAGSSKTKTSRTDIGDYRSNPEENCELHSSDSDGDKEKLKSPSKIPQLGFHDHKQVLCSQNDDKEDNEYRRQKGLVRGSSDEEIESDKIETCQGPTNPSNIPKQSSHVHVVSINDNEGQCSENDEKNLKLKRKRKSDGDISDEKDDSGSGKPSNIPKHACYPPARPMTKPIWNGSLSLMSSEKYRTEYRTVGGLVAHLSSLACCKVFEEAKLLPGLLCLDLLPRSFVWPKSYEKIRPSDDSIGLFLFPNNERDEKVYNGLVNDMISQDLAMRGSVKNAELLIFTSRILPLHLWTLTDKSYLWGVFRGKQQSEANVAEAQPSTSKKRKMSAKGKGKPHGAKKKKNVIGKKETAPKGKCFYCGIVGHWKRNCIKYLEKLKKAKQDN